MRRFSFEELIKHCVDRQSPQHNAAWRQFYDDYKGHIYKCVGERVRDYNNSLANRDPGKLTDDNVLIVLETLRKKLGNFRVKEGEKKFLRYLATTSCNAVNQYMRPKYISGMVDPPKADQPFSRKKIGKNTAFEVYDFLIRTLRRSNSGKGNIERDIHIFYLYKMNGLSQTAVAGHPCMEKVNPRIVEVATARIRKSLKNNPEFIDRLKS